jgi:hypothetical protein
MQKGVKNSSNKNIYIFDNTLKYVLKISITNLTMYFEY